MNGVDRDEAGPAAGLGSLAKADGHRRRARPRPHGALAAVRGTAAEIVDVAVGNPSKPLEPRIPEQLELATQDDARGEPGHLPERLVALRKGLELLDGA